RTAAEDDMARKVDKAVREAEPHHFLFRGSDPLNETFGELPFPRIPELTSYSTLYLAAAAWADGEINELLRGLSYLGPIREPLRRVYEISGDPPRDVGTRGEFAPEILLRHPWLLDETQTWLARFGFGRRVELRTDRDAAFSLVLSGRPSI